MDMNAQERLVAAMEMLCQDIELYTQAQREAHLQIKEEVLNLIADAFMAGNPCASLEIMSQDIINLDNLKLGQDLLLHQVKGHWEALTDAARELYHGAGVEQQIPFDLFIDGGDANWRKMERSMHDLTRVMKVVARNNSHNGTSLFKDFRSLDPPRFAGSTDPDEAENWLKDIEWIFRMIKCTEEEKVCITTFQLDQDARAWWETVEATLEDSNQLPVDSQPKAVDRRMSSRTPDFWTVYLSTALLLLSTDTHRPRKPELCLLPSVDSPFLAVDRTDQAIEDGGRDCFVTKAGVFNSFLLTPEGGLEASSHNFVKVVSTQVYCVLTHPMYLASSQSIKELVVSTHVDVVSTQCMNLGNSQKPIASVVDTECLCVDTHCPSQKLVLKPVASGVDTGCLCVDTHCPSQKLILQLVDSVSTQVQSNEG
ncbi:hypothetical protein Taro_017507 [Colocasia esculenta]|uniref:Uncharacterized protein n=1 Tax=Colocasia esculenta TaxID=4460 RepID=A0A843UGD0_COLES|nr:hypothetical protein [Colocasia esculenta]